MPLSASSSSAATCQHDGSSEMMMIPTTGNDRRRILSRLYLATFLSFILVVVELVGGIWSSSLATLSDAAHLFIDLASLGIAIIAAHLATLPTSEQFTFGLKRAESLAALLSMLALAMVTIGLCIEAVYRLIRHNTDDSYYQVDGQIVMIVAMIGVFVNLVLAVILGGNHHLHYQLPGANSNNWLLRGFVGNRRNNNNNADDEHFNLLDKKLPPTCVTATMDSSSSSPTMATTTTTKMTTTFSTMQTSTWTPHDGQFKLSPITAVPEEEPAPPPPPNKTGWRLLWERLSQEKVYTATEEDDDSKPNRNINLHAAYLHVLGDLAQSVGLLMAGLLTWFHPSWGYIIDPVCTFVFSAFILLVSVGVFQASLSVLLERVPPHISYRHMEERIRNVHGVVDCHELHIWSVSHGKAILSVHCTMDDNPNIHAQDVLQRVAYVVRQEGIARSTIQIQRRPAPPTRNNNNNNNNNNSATSTVCFSCGTRQPTISRPLAAAVDASLV